MRCPHCGYNSFAHLEHCKKCGHELKQIAAETKNLEANAVTDSATVKDEDTPTAPADMATPHSGEQDAGNAEERPSDAETDVVGDSVEFEPEPALFAGSGLISSPEGENEKEDLVEPDLRSTNVSPQRGDDMSASKTRFGFSPEGHDTAEQHHAEYETSRAYLPWETSLQIDEYPPQGRALIRRRFLASVLDITVIIFVWLVFYAWGYNLLWHGDAGFFAPLLHNSRARGGFYLLIILIALAYFILFHYINGQTPGKVLTKIRVVACDSEPLTLAQVLLRTCGGFVSALCLGAGYIVILWTRDARGWNDKLADTRVDPALTEDIPTAGYE
jgi:uncharacterized RDD family membrane protein YckC